jgi:hypothetical protein
MIRGLGSDVEWVLRAALADRAPATEAARRFLAEFEPDAFLDPRAYAALPAVYTRLKSVAAPNDPHWTLVAGVTRQAWTRNQLCISAVRSGLDALERVGATPLVFPGAVTAMAALGNSRARMLDRIDLMIDPQHIPRVAAALVAVGATIRQDHAPLFDGRVAEHTTIFAEFAGGALVVRWDHPVIRRETIERFRAGSEPMLVGTLHFNGLAPEDALIAVLADLTDSDPGPVGWTNLILELGRIRRRLDAHGACMGTVARVAHDAGRHNAWADQLRLLAQLSGDHHDAAAAERFADVAPPHALPAPRGTSPRRRRSSPRRALRMLRQYRTAAAGRNEPVTLRGLARFLEHRWQLAGAHDLPRAVARRLLSARRPQSPTPSSRSSSNNVASRTSNE